MGFFLSFIFGVFPMFFYAAILYWTDRYEKEPLKLLGGVFLWGMLVAAGSAFIVNTGMGIGIYLFTNSEAVTDLTTSTLVAPLVEEILKGFGVLIVYILFHNEFDSILDGIIYAGITALGFAATENIYYIYTYGFLEGGMSGLLWLVFVRVILVGWQHAFYTAFTGIGFAFSRLSKGKLSKVIFPFIGLLLAILSHSIHNTLSTILTGLAGVIIGTLIDWSGWFMMILVIIWAIHRDRKWMIEYLKDEINHGLITQHQYHIATSSLRVVSAKTTALLHGNYKNTNRFYQLCAELAHKKHQMAILGDENGNLMIANNIREQIRQLAEYVPE